MPRPCAVEIHVCRYEERWNGFGMPRPCAVEVHVYWRVTANLLTKSMKRETPRRKAVASREILFLSDSREREPPRHKAVASVSVATPTNLIPQLALTAAEQYKLLQLATRNRPSYYPTVLG
jgi:hypothetical protein